MGYLLFLGMTGWFCGMHTGQSIQCCWSQGLFVMCIIPSNPVPALLDP